MRFRTGGTIGPWALFSQSGEQIEGDALKAPRRRRADDTQEPLAGDAVPGVPGPGGGQGDAEVVGENLDGPPKLDDLFETVHGGTLGLTPNCGQGLLPNEVMQTGPVKEEQAKRLREARALAGYATASDASRAFGWNSTYFDHENGRRGMRPSVAARYAKAYRVKSSWLLYGESESPNVRVRTLDRRVPVVGEVRAGAWVKVAFAEDIQYELSVSLPEYDRAKLFGLTVTDRSAGPYIQGSVVVVCPKDEAGVQNEDYVVVREYRDNLAETTIKHLRVNASGEIELWPCPPDLARQPPLKYARAANSQAGIEIIGVVVASYLPKRAGRGPILDI